MSLIIADVTFVEVRVSADLFSGGDSPHFRDVFIGRSSPEKVAISEKKNKSVDIGQFFMVVIAGSVFQLFGPLTYVRGNSRFYSGEFYHQFCYDILILILNSPAA